MIILVLNCGSSSIKYQFFEMGEKADVIAKRTGGTDWIYRCGHLAHTHRKRQIQAYHPHHGPHHGNQPDYGSPGR